MSGPVIIRLQNLPLEARSIDIRKFFDGLVIPDGGVHIIGGERGDAFIAFQSDDDARLAMSRDGMLLCNSKIKLYLSSKNEMQSIIATARNQLQQTNLPTPPSIPSSIEKILFNKTASSSASSSSNPLDLLNSISKLFNKPPPSQQQQQPVEPPKPEPVTTVPVQPNININEILSIIKNNINPKAEVKEPLLPTPKRKLEEPVAAKPIKTPLLATPPAQAAQTSNRQVLDPIIRVKNFTPNCSYKDIRTFLQGIQIEHNGIKFIQDSNGQHKGQAFVRLVSIIDLKKALCRNGQFFEDRQIEVFRASELDLSKKPPEQQQQQQQQISKPVVQSSDSPGFYIKIYGLPANFDESSLKNMFNNVKFIRILTSNPTPIQSKITNQDGSTETKTIIKAKKLCEVETQLDVERALTRQDERVGKNKVQIFQISKSEYEREIGSIKGFEEEANNFNNNNNIEEDEEQEEGLKEVYLHMSGVPYSAKSEDVRSFFQGLELREINLLVDKESLKPTGECCCEFLSRQDRDRALSKHDQLFRNRVVKIKPLNQVEYQRYLASSKQKQLRVNNNKPIKPALLATPISPSEKPKLLAEIQQRQNSEEEEDNEEEEEEYSNRNKRIRTGEIDLPPLPPELRKYQNSIVLLSNVAYEATREDILELFKYFGPIEQTLKIRHDDRGQPTGDAIVACRSHDEAVKACRSLNGVDFMGRNIRAVLISP